jgi:CDP-diacylglycerol---glycerol-3-phosphate 3-phosphatidyltransferase
MMSSVFPFRGTSGRQEIAASLLFILASITDGVDGYLARKRGQITTMGMLLDPLADKLMITAVGRDFLVSGLRSIASSEGFTIEASDLGKLKTVIQIVSVVAVILDHRWYAWHFGWFILPVHWVAIAAIYFMVLVSIISAVDYFAAFWRKIDHAAAERRTKASFVLSRKKNMPAANNLS